MRFLFSVLVFFPILSFANDEPRDCQFSWTASVSINVVGYNFYLDNKVIKKGIQSLEFTKTCELGEYYITAVNSGGIESVPSESVFVLKPKSPVSVELGRDQNGCNAGTMCS